MYVRPPHLQPELAALAKQRMNVLPLFVVIRHVAPHLKRMETRQR